MNTLLGTRKGFAIAPSLLLVLCAQMSRAAAAAETHAKVKLNETATVLAAAVVSMSEPIISPDLRHIAFVDIAPGENAFVIDGKKQKSYPLVQFGAWSPDSKRFIYYAATQGEPQEIWTVLDGVEGQRYSAITERGPVWSADSEHYAYGAYREGGGYIIVDGRESGPYSEGIIGEPTFSAQGGHWGAIAAADGQKFAVVDGRELPRFRGIARGTPELSKDGTRWAFGAQNEKKRWHCVVDFQTFGPFIKWDHRGLFSPDGKHFGFLGAGDLKTPVNYVDGQAEKIDGVVPIMPPMWGPSGEDWGWVGRKGQRLVMVKNGKAGAPFDGGVASPIFSPDGKRLAIAVQGKQVTMSPATDPKRGAAASSQCHMKIDGKNDPVYAWLWPELASFSPDSKRFTYMAATKVSTGPKLNVIDGVAGPVYDDATAVRFSPDSRRWAHTAMKGGKWLTVVDGVEGAAYDHARLVAFSPDSRHFAYVVKRGEKMAVVMDGSESAEYDTIVRSRFLFDGSDRVRFIARREHEYMSVELQIAP